jgi:hypothetical protein
MTRHYHHPKRNQKASMLLIGLGAAFLVVFAIAVAFFLAFPFLMQKRTQTTADSAALELAANLNLQDRAGQMNNLVVLCRNLVYTSRKTYQSCSSDYQHLEPLARQLMQESRGSAQKVEQERRSLISLTLADLRTSFDKTKQMEALQATLKLPGMTAEPAMVDNVTLGSIKDIESNVQTELGIPDLVSADRGAGYIQKGSDLYMGNIDARLPGQDSDLIFKISSLPAPVSGELAKARLTLANVFKPMALFVKGGQVLGSSPDYTPSALKVEMVHNLKTEISKDPGANLKVSATGTCGGGGVMP